MKILFITFLNTENLRMVGTSYVMFASLISQILQKFWYKTTNLFMQIEGLKISLENRAYLIQHTQIMINSLVPNFY